MSGRRPAGVTHSDTFIPLGAATFYVPTGWHHEQRCRSCGAVVDYRDDATHTAFHTQLAELQALVEQLTGGVPPPSNGGEAAPDDLAQRANEYGEAAGYPGRGAAQFWGEAFRQVGELMVSDWRWLRGRLRRPGHVPQPALKGPTMAPKMTHSGPIYDDI